MGVVHSKEDGPNGEKMKDYEVSSFNFIGKLIAPYNYALP